jgi:tRNA(fMet)-specific endonuclease VapC
METIIIDSNILIEFYRQKDKSQTVLFKLASSYQFQVSAITKYEIYRGDKNKDAFWDTFFSSVPVLSFDSPCADVAANIYKELKSKNLTVDTDDILIAATAIKNNLRLATINRKHFNRIDELNLIDF